MEGSSFTTQNNLECRKAGCRNESPLRDLARQLRNVAKAHLAYSQVVEVMQVLDAHINALAYIEELHREETQS
jgi:hypothetical protein